MSNNRLNVFFIIIELLKNFNYRSNPSIFNYEVNSLTNRKPFWFWHFAAICIMISVCFQQGISKTFQPQWVQKYSWCGGQSIEVKVIYFTLFFEYISHYFIKCLVFICVKYHFTCIMEYILIIGVIYIWVKMAKYHLFWKFLAKKHYFGNKWQIITFSRTRVSETRVPHQFCHRGIAELDLCN